MSDDLWSMFPLNAFFFDALKLTVNFWSRSRVLTYALEGPTSCTLPAPEQCTHEMLYDEEQGMADSRNVLENTPLHPLDTHL